MRAVLQRVSQAKVRVGERRISQISRGLMIFLGVRKGDTEEDAQYIVDKIIHLRVFPSDDSSFSDSVLTISGQLLIVSQFTLFANTQKGRRPDFSQAEASDRAEQIYQHTVELFHHYPLNIQTGEFGASMNVQLVNEGPVTIILDSQTMRDTTIPG